MENSIQESNMSSKMNGPDVCDNEDEKKLKSDENNEDKLTPLIIQDRQTEIMASEDMNEGSRKIVDDNVKFESLNLIYFTILAYTYTLTL